MLPLTDRSIAVDFNYILQRQQISLFKAENAACEKSRAVHRAFAHAYAAEIASVRIGWLKGAAA